MNAIDIQALRNAAEAADNVTAQVTAQVTATSEAVTVTYELSTDDVEDAEAFASILVRAAGREPDEAGPADPGFYMIWK